MNGTRFTSRHGALVAEALQSCWRENPDPCELSDEELASVSPILLKSGAAGLVWWRLDRTGRTPPTEFLKAYKQQTLEAAVHEDNIARVFRVLEDAKLNALVVKGWAAARLYPDPALRRYSDLDLCVAAKDFERAAALLKRERTKDIWIDLHESSASLDYATEEELFRRSRGVAIDGTSARVPSPEDHLRILCLHLLRHGGWRPLWLCDVARVLESREANFDWKIFFGRDEIRADWLACVLGLAHKLLGARLDDSPISQRAAQLPEWLPCAILRRWSRWYNSDYRDEVWTSLWSHKTQPLRFLEDAYFRCDPIRATVDLEGRFDNNPRLPYQFAALARRASKVLVRMFRS